MSSVTDYSRRCLVTLLFKLAGAGNKGAHNIYIWDRETGTLVKILEGPKDSCEDLDVSRTSSTLGNGR